MGFLVNIVCSSRSWSLFPQKFLTIIISFYLYMYLYGALDVSLNVCKVLASLFSWVECENKTCQSSHACNLTLPTMHDQSNHVSLSKLLGSKLSPKFQRNSILLSPFCWIVWPIWKEKCLLCSSTLFDLNSDKPNVGWRLNIRHGNMKQISTLGIIVAYARFA